MSAYIAALCCFLGLSSSQIIFPKSCLTPNSEYAQCLPLQHCPRLAEALATKDPVTLEFVELSKCGGTEANPSVCCGPSSNFTVAFDSRVKEVTESEEATPPKYLEKRMQLLPNRSFCGYQHSDDYIGDESNTTKISEFPWLAAIFAKNGDLGNETTLACVGSVINNRYVLTQAYCVNQQNLISVHLGEYDLSTDEDCVQESQFARECTEPVQVANVEKTIVHPGYSSDGLGNDIALIRLNRTIRYNDYVRPICLPFPGTTFARADAMVRSSGWGTKEKAKLAASTIKKKIWGRLTALESCAEAFVEEKDTIGNGNYLCVSTRGITSDLGCDGDAGRPLVYSYKAQWHQEGIATRLGSCNGQNPDVYRKIADYLDWILENIEK